MYLFKFIPSFHFKEDADPGASGNPPLTPGASGNPPAPPAPNPDPSPTPPAPNPADAAEEARKKLEAENERLKKERDQALALMGGKPPEAFDMNKALREFCGSYGKDGVIKVDTSGVVHPVRDAHGNVKTNVQVVREFGKIMHSMRDGKGALTQRERDTMEENYYRIMGGEHAESIMAWVDQICAEPDDEKAQRLIERTLMPIK